MGNVTSLYKTYDIRFLCLQLQQVIKWPDDLAANKGTPLAKLELATNFWLLVLSILHKYAWDL